MAVRDIDFRALSNLRSNHGAEYPRGSVLFHQGDTSSEMYVVLQGTVEMRRSDFSGAESRVVRTVPAGQFFGEMSCFVGRPRSATAVVSEDAVLLRFSRDSALELLATSPKFALGVIQTLCDRIIDDGETIGHLRRKA